MGGSDTNTVSSGDTVYNAGLLELQKEDSATAKTYDNFYKYGVLYDPTEEVTVVKKADGSYTEYTRQAGVKAPAGVTTITRGELEGYDDEGTTSGMEYASASIEAQNSLLAGETSAAASTNALTSASNESALSLIPSSTEAALSSNQLTTAQNQSALSTLPTQTSVNSAYLNSALTGVDVDAKANEAQADVEQASKNSMSALRQNAAMTGLNPASGAFSSAMVNSALDKTKAIASARQTAKTTAEDTNFNRLASAASV